MVAHTNGSAKRVQGWMQAGYGVWFGEGHERNVSLQVPAHGRHSIRQGKLRNVLRVLLSQAQAERTRAGGRAQGPGDAHRRRGTRTGAGGRA